VIHSRKGCPRLMHSDVPKKSVKFAGKGTAGWLKEKKARKLDGADYCHFCWNVVDA